MNNILTTDPSNHLHDALNDDQRATLLQLAKESIQYGLAHGRPLEPVLDDFSDIFKAPGATFVTLTLNDQLRGCIGSLIAHQPLVIDLTHNAFSAAFRDHRFTPVSEREYPYVSVQISLLSSPEALDFNDEAALMNQIRPHIDGLILSDHGHKSTFLPAVWDQLPDKNSFLEQLKLKAGLPKDYWSDTLSVSRYTVACWGDKS